MSLLIGFSGQGGQHSKMFSMLSKSKFGRAWLKEASTLANLDLFDESVIEEACSDVVEVQNMLVILSLGAFYVLEQEQRLVPTFLCGYSLGEVVAFCASAGLNLTESYTLTRQRALMMQQAAEAIAGEQGTGLIVLKGRINYALVKTLCEKFACYVAIVNAEDHYIVGGRSKALDNLMLEAKKHSVLKVAKLAVKLASHTPLLAKATEVFAVYLQNFAACEMRYPVLNALTQERIFKTHDMLPILAKELSQTLHWDRVMAIAKEFGISSFLELGPRAALKNMMTTAIPGMQAYNLEGFSSFNGLMGFLGNC